LASVLSSVSWVALAEPLQDPLLVALPLERGQGPTQFLDRLEGADPERIPPLVTALPHIRAAFWHRTPGLLPDVAEIAIAWHRLPEAVRAGILAMVMASRAA
jgi:hypothetical protein